MLLSACKHCPFCISFRSDFSQPFRDQKQEGASADWALGFREPHKSRSVTGWWNLGLRHNLKHIYIYVNKLTLCSGVSISLVGAGVPNAVDLNVSTGSSAAT